jgi:hypothetical protein
LRSCREAEPPAVPKVVRLVPDHTGQNRSHPREEALKEYRDEAMKHLEAAEKVQPAENGDVAWANYRVNASIAASLIDIAETLHAIRAGVDKQVGLDQY